MIELIQKTVLFLGWKDISALDEKTISLLESTGSNAIFQEKHLEALDCIAEYGLKGNPIDILVISETTLKANYDATINCVIDFFGRYGPKDNYLLLGENPSYKKDNYTKDLCKSLTILIEE